MGTKTKHERRFARCFLLPSLLIILLIYLYPVLSAIYNSLRDGTLLNAGQFVGTANYSEMFSLSKFWSALRFSLGFACVVVPFAFLLGLSIALLLNTDIPFRGFFRAALLIPWIVPSVVSVVCWRWLIIDDHSLINVMLGWFHIEPIYFLSEGIWPFITVCIVKIWKQFPFVAVSLLAALQTIDSSTIEAARIDGANAWNVFLHIKLPSIAPVSFVCLVLLTIWSYNDYDILRMLTNGGPMGRTTNMMILAADFAFNKNKLGISCAIALFSLVLITVLAQFLLRRTNQEE